MRTFAMRLLYEGPNANSVQDLERPSSSKQEHNKKHSTLSRQQHSGATSSPWMMPIKDNIEGVTRRLHFLQATIEPLIEEGYALASYTSFEASESGLLDDVKTISKVPKHKEVVEKLQEPMKRCMQTLGFVQMLNIAQGWPEFVNMPIEVMAAALSQFPSASKLALFFTECMQSGGASLSDLVEGPNVTASQKEAINSLMELEQCEALECALEWRALSRLRRPRNAIGHAFVKDCSNEWVQEKILKVLEASKTVAFTKDFSRAAKVCQAVATATKADKNTPPRTLDLDFGTGF